VFTDVLEPYPAEITQKEPQYMRLRDSHYFYSPYTTETQKTTYKLASGNIESFTKLAPFTNKGASIQYGPYENVAPFSVRDNLLDLPRSLLRAHTCYSIPRRCRRR
jgi:oligosaccharyltransferase complex subunit alpha (ribophorin I)